MTAVDLLAGADLPTAPLSLAQERIWLLEELGEPNGSFNVFCARRVVGRVDRAALVRAVAALAERHPALRTGFAVKGGEVSQYVVDATEGCLTQLTLGSPPGDDQVALERATAALSLEVGKPFDLTAPPLLRVIFGSISDEQHVLGIVVHHIVCDGWSMQVLVEDLDLLYRRECGGSAVPATGTRTHLDLAREQRARLTGEHLDATIEFWSERLQGLAPLTLGAEGATTTAGGNGASEWVSVPADLRARLSAYGRRLRCTESTVLLAAFQVLLARWTGEAVFGVGAPAAARADTDDERIVGLLTDTVVLRTDLTSDPTFDEVVRAARTATLEAIARPHVPFEQLRHGVAPHADRAPFQVMFNAQTYARTNGRLGDALLEPLLIAFPWSKVDLTLEVWPDPDRLLLNLEYRTDRLDAATVGRFGRCLLTLLDGLLAAPSQPAYRAPILSNTGPTAADWQHIIGRLSCAPTTSVTRTVLQDIDRVSRIQPDAVAVRCGDEQITYRQVVARAAAIAARLRAHGVQRRDIVGVCVSRSVDLIPALLAVSAAGATYLPLDPAHPTARLAVMVGAASARVVLCDDAGIACLPAHLGLELLLVRDVVDDVQDQPEAWPENAATLDDPAYLIFTSGSTGQPKGVLTTHSALARRAAWMRDRYQLGPLDSVLQYASISFDTHAEEIFPALMSGATLIELNEDPRALRDFLASSHAKTITVLDLPTSMWHELVRFVDRVSWPSGLRLVILGADQLSAAALSTWQAHMGAGIEVINTYGPTEATIIASAQVMTGAHADSAPPIGAPIDDTRLYVLDRSLNPLPPGVVGQLYVGGTALALGYHADAAKTADRFLPDPFGDPGSRMYATGDLVRWSADGALIFQGRVDHQIKHRGFRIEPGDVETRILADANVAQAVVAIAEHAGASHLSAWIVASAGGEPDTAELQRELTSHLPAYMIPTLWTQLDSLPLNVNGKLDRSRLPTPLPPATTSPGHDTVAPRTPTEQTIASVFGAVLGVSDVAIDDDFFGLGGHSLLATQAAGRLEELLRQPVPVRDIFTYSTVRGLAAVVHDRSLNGIEASSGPSARLASLPAVPASPSQERMWFLDRMSEGDASYNLPVAARLRGPISLAALRRALDAVVARHEALRTRFDDRGATLMQVVEEPERVQFDHIPLIEAAGMDAAKKLIGAHANTPFDLTRAPLLRALVVRLSPNDHVLSLVVHHIVSDGWSVGVMLRDLSRAYRAVTTGQPQPVLPEVGLHYADYTEWRRLQQGDDTDAAVTYWTQTLRGLPVLNLPTTFPRPATRGSAGGFFAVPLPGSVRDKVLDLARDLRCTEFMVLLAAFQVLLGRYSGQQDFAVGSPIAGRGRTELDDVVGLFTNTLVMRADLTGCPTFEHLLDRVRERTLDAFSHQDIPFERVISELRPARDLARNPLFDVLFVLQNAPSSGLAFDEVSVDGIDPGFGHAKFDLTLEMWPSPDGYQAIFGYSTDLFDASFVDRLGLAWTTLLEGLLDNPQAPIDRVPLVAATGATARSWNEIIIGFNAQPTRGSAGPGTVIDQIGAAVKVWTDRVAVSCDGDTLTYGQLGGRISELAHRLRRNGVTRGDVIGVYAARSVDLVVAAVAVMAVAGVYLPLDVDHPPARTDAVLAQAGARLVLVGSESRDQVPEAAGRVHLPIRLSSDVSRVPTDCAWPTDGPTTTEPAYMIFTSGSTGRPKGVVSGHAGLTNRLSWMSAALDIDDRDVVGHKTSIGFDVSVWELLLPLTVGARLELARPGGHRDPTYLHQWIDDNGVSVVHFVPSMLIAWLETAATSSVHIPHPTLRVVVSSGEALQATTAAAFAAAYPKVELYNLYGPTEASIDVSSYRCETSQPRSTGTVPIGRPIDQTRLYVLDAGLAPVPVGVPGQLYIAGVGLAFGYHGDSAMTASKFLPDPFGPSGERMYATGDRAAFDEHGILTYLGRLDDQIKLHGHRIEPGEIEARLVAHPHVSQAAVGVTEHGGEARLTAWYLTTDVIDPGPEALRDHLAAVLPAYLVPTAWLRMSEFPVTASHKLDRARLPVPRPSMASERGAPTPQTMSLLEQTIAAAWAECLGVPTVGPDDDFFLLGGHSLTAARLVSRLRIALPPGTRPLGVMHVFTHPTVRQQAQLSRELGPSGDPTLLHRLDRSLAPAKLTLVCFPYAGGSPVVFRPLADSVPDDVALHAVSIPGHDPGIDDEPQALETVAARVAQEILATVEGPVALYGHSAGAAFALETARVLERAGRTLVAVYVGSIFPVARPGGPLRALWDVMRKEWLVTESRYAEGLRAAGMDIATLDRADLHLIVRAMRRDAREAEAYFTARLNAKEDLLDAPIVAVVGERDPDTEFYQERHREWLGFSRSASVAVIDEANHFFPKFRSAELAEVLTEASLLPEHDRHPLYDSRPKATPGRSDGRWWVGGAARIEPATTTTGPRPSMTRFLLVAGGQSLSLTGSALTEFALPLWLLVHTGSVARFGLMAFLALVPGLIAGPFAGVVVDRFSRRRVMLTADMAALAIEGAVVTELALRGTHLWALYLFIAILSAVLPFQRLAFLSAVPQLVPKQFLGHAAGIVQTGAGVAQFVVPVAAAGCFATIGLRGILVLDLLSYMVCILTVVLVRFPATLAFRRRESIAKELREGLRLVLGRQAFRPLIGFFAALNLLLSPLLLLVSPLVLNSGSLRDVAVVSTAGAVGALVGSLIMTARGGGRGNTLIACAWTAAALGAAAMLTAARPSTTLTATGLAVVLACLAAINVRYTLTVQRKVPRRFHGRAFAILGTAAYTTIPVGFAVVAPLATWLLTRPANTHWARTVLGRSVDQDPTVAYVFMLFGAIIVVFAVLVARSRRARSFDQLPDAPPDDIVGLDAVTARLAGTQNREIPRANYPTNNPDREEQHDVRTHD